MISQDQAKRMHVLSPCSSGIILPLFSKERGSFRERRGRLLYPDLKQSGRHNWGRVSGCCVQIVSLTFREAAVGRREGEAWHRPSSDFMGDGRRKERRVHCRGLDPSDGQLKPPRENARSGSGGSLTDEQEHRGGSRRARRGCYDTLCSPLAGVSWRAWTSACG